MIDFNSLMSGAEKRARYQRQLERILTNTNYIANIEEAVENSIENLKNNCRSFVIYGEPQSGKTEMMIALTARLLDEGHKIIVILLNDSVQLLSQNLERFKRSGIDPAPKNFSEILDSVISIDDSNWVIFCKKNPHDLKKLIERISKYKNKVIIDDEADYASPNAKINKGEKTKINSLIEKLLSKNGIYIGVTATPARLDLNNTFRNENEGWIDFPPNHHYKGQNIFFPVKQETLAFNLETLPTDHDDPKYLRKALFSYLVTVAHLNHRVSSAEEKNYCMLIHTSGKRADHTKDYKDVVKTLNILKNKNNSQWKKYYTHMWDLAKEKYPTEEDGIVSYIYANVNRHSIVVMNSDTDKTLVDFQSATSPATLFTFAIGGNIVSRGVTFENLLSMFFTRDVKHKIQQDTYIQRARMFGPRGDYLEYFELHIPDKLYLDWHKCFVFHRLSLESIRAGNGAPVWLEDRRVSAVAPGSIDKSTVSIASGEMSFEMFDYTNSIDRILSEDLKPIEKLQKLAGELGERKIPQFLLEYIEHFSPQGESSLAIHPSASMAGGSTADQDRIARIRGFLGGPQLEKNKYPHAIHHIKILYNAKKKARVFYRYVGNIRFLKTLRK